MTQPTFLTEQEECWALGGEIMDQGMAHPALLAVVAALDEVRAALEEVRAQSRQLKKHGVGRTEDPTLILARVVPRIRSLGESAEAVADQLAARLRRG